MNSYKVTVNTNVVVPNLFRMGGYLPGEVPYHTDLGIFFDSTVTLPGTNFAKMSCFNAASAIPCLAAADTVTTSVTLDFDNYASFNRLILNTKIAAKDTDFNYYVTIQNKQDTVAGFIKYLFLL